MNTAPHALRNGLLLGLLGVLIFALTLPLTRLAVGTPAAPQLSGVFVSSGRATVAALLSIVFLWATRAPWPRRADQVICWALIIGLPINLPLALMQYPQTAINFDAWLGFFYVAIFSQWLGFFAWYRGLALGGTVRVSQMQLLQPFMSMLFAVPILGESLDALTIGFGLAVIVTVAVGRKMPVRATHAPSPPALPARAGCP